MMLNPIPTLETVAPPQTCNERICETIRERTNRRGLPGNNRKSKSASRNTSRGTSRQYTPRQRETMQKGLRIMARIIARTHLGGKQTGATRPRQVRRRKVNPGSEPSLQPAPPLRHQRCAGIPFALPHMQRWSPKRPFHKGRLPGPAIPQNCLQNNVLQGITGNRFLPNNGVLVHCHGRDQIDNNQHQHANSNRG